MAVRPLAAALLLAAAPAAGALDVPHLSGPVVDEAGLLDARSARALADLCRAARDRDGGRGVQLQYLIVRSLDGEALEDFSMKVAEAWRIGSKGQDNGVLVLVALEDRKVRIEVGGGIEGGLTDAQSGRIIRNTIAPAFRERRYGEGLYAAGVQILSALGAMPEGVKAPRRPAGRGTPWATVAFAVLVLVMIGSGIVSSLLGPRRPGGRGPWSGWGGGGWGGGLGGGLGGGFGGGGGGGWSGGGGGFSGGGASGGW